MAKGRVWTGEQVCWESRGRWRLPGTATELPLLNVAEVATFCAPAPGINPPPPIPPPLFRRWSWVWWTGWAAWRTHLHWPRSRRGCRWRRAPCASSRWGQQRWWVDTVLLILCLQGVACHAKVEWLKPAEACLLCGPHPSLASLAPPRPTLSHPVPQRPGVPGAQVAAGTDGQAGAWGVAGGWLRGRARGCPRRLGGRHGAAWPAADGWGVGAAAAGALGQPGAAMPGPCCRASVCLSVRPGDGWEGLVDGDS